MDFFRGIALWFIFVDHIPTNALGSWSLRNFALCDSTEVFVLLAGYAATKAYGRTYDRQGWVSSGADVLRRAWTLYIAHIFLFVVFSAQVSYSATALDRSDYLEEIHLDVLADAPYRAMLHALTLDFQPAYLNILPIYIAMLVLLAFALPLLNRPWTLGLLSFAIYAAARTFNLNLPSWTDGGWYFNPFCWQFLFFLGVLMARHSLRPPLPKVVIDAAAVGILLFGLVLLFIVWPSDAISARVPASLARTLLLVDKEGMHPMRVLSILSLTWLVIRLIPVHAVWLRGAWAYPAVLAGQHSLPVFCCGIFLSFVGRIFLEQSDAWPMQIAVNVAGPVLLLAVAALAAWYRDKARALRSDLPPRPHADSAKLI